VTLPEALAILASGVAAGTINTVVGSGTLVTFPVLLSVGYPPVVANVSNTIGLVPGSISGAIGYRRELRGQRDRALRLSVASVLGGLAGGGLLFAAPEEAFEAVVPVFIAVALVLILAQPRLSAYLRDRRHGEPRTGAGTGIRARLAVFATGIYGGYFGAAQGIMLLAVLGLATDDDMQRLNALKNVLAGLVNLVAGILFVIIADVAWGAVALIAAGSVLGGTIGARFGRRLSPALLRSAVIVVGLTAIVQLLG
jgi:uncharacterized membrane protein YfcA